MELELELGFWVLLGVRVCLFSFLLIASDPLGLDLRLEARVVRVLRSFKTLLAVSGMASFKGTARLGFCF